MAACDGGIGSDERSENDGSVTSHASTALDGAKRASTLTGSTPEASNQAPLNIQLLLNWAEREHPDLFPGNQINLQSTPYTYRYYPATKNYVGVAGDDVYILGALSNHVLTRVGRREEFRCRVTPADCCSPGYARSGWMATLSTLQHGVSGTVTIVGARTLRLSGFNYDGGGPQVFAYLGCDDSQAAFVAGKIIGSRLNRSGQPCVNATIDLQLREGRTLDNFSALSIWCAAFNANFGSGVFKPPNS